MPLLPHSDRDCQLTFKPISVRLLGSRVPQGKQKPYVKGTSATQKQAVPSAPSAASLPFVCFLFQLQGKIGSKNICLHSPPETENVTLHVQKAIRINQGRWKYACIFCTVKKQSKIYEYAFFFSIRKYCYKTNKQHSSPTDSPCNALNEIASCLTLLLWNQMAITMMSYEMQPKTLYFEGIKDLIGP